MPRLRRNALVLLINNLGNAALAFCISILVGRGLGAAGFGQYTFVMAWVGPFVMLADFGMGSLITRDVARDRSMAGAMIHTANRAIPLISVPVLLGSWLLAATSNAAPIVILALLIASLLVILDPWYGLYTALFRAFERMEPILILNIGGFAAQFLMTLAALQLGAGLVGTLIALIAVNIAQLAAIWLWWGRLATDRPSVGPLPIAVGVFVRRASPFALAAVLAALASRLNVYLLERFADDAAVGLYGAASRIVEAGRLVPNAFFGALFPALTALAVDPEGMRSLYRRSLLSFGLIGAAIALGAVLLGGWFIRLAFGAGFEGAAPVVAVLSWSLVPSVLRGVVSLYLYGRGREALVNRMTVLAILLQAIIGAPLVIVYGAVGAAFTSIAVESAAALGLWIGARR